MPKLCTNIVDPIHILEPGAILPPGSELIDGTGQLDPDDEIGSVMVNEIEELPPRFIQDEKIDGVVISGEHGAVAKIPVNNLLFTFQCFYHCLSNFYNGVSYLNTRGLQRFFFRICGLQATRNNSACVT